MAPVFVTVKVAVAPSDTVGPDESAKLGGGLLSLSVIVPVPVAVPKLAPANGAESVTDSVSLGSRAESSRVVTEIDFDS